MQKKVCKQKTDEYTKRNNEIYEAYFAAKESNKNLFKLIDLPLYFLLERG